MIIAPLLQAASSLPADLSALQSCISDLEISISALESKINDLEISSARWEPWVWVFSVLVVIGVVMELWIVRHDWLEDMEEWAIWDFMGIVRHPSRPPIRKLRVEIASVLLISIGVAGELGVGVEISHINGTIRNKAGDVRILNGELRNKSDRLVALLNVKAGKLEKETNQLRTANDKAEAKLEEEKRKRLELAASLLPRELRDELGLVKALSVLPPVLVRFEYREEGELIQIAEQIHAVIAASQWKAWRKRGNEPMIREGITVSAGTKPLAKDSPDWSLWSQQEQMTWEVCDSVAKALKDTGGLDVEVGNSGYDLPPGTILISVGTKPNHAAEEAIRELSMPRAQHLAGPRGTRVAIPDSEPTKPIGIKLVK